MSVLITGATGQVGNAIARRLAADGVHIRALVHSRMRGTSNVLPEGVQTVFGDVTDAASLRGAFDGCDTVYHAAGIPEQWRRDPAEFTRVNAEGTRHVVEAALASGVKRFVYTSTDDVLLAAPGIPFDEPIVDRTPGRTPYQRSKREADRIVTAALDRGLPAVFLHPSGVYGPAPFLTRGLNDLLVGLALRKVPALLPGGMTLVYSEDVADGHIRAASRAEVGARYILTESYQPLIDIARAVVRVASSARVPRIMPLALANAIATIGEPVARLTGRPPMIPRSLLQFLERDARPTGTRARAELEWRPIPFVTGVERSLAYFGQRGWTRSSS
ncbi:MAG TPA: NAD-dependent epimerase/dehydratase family protein [Vicinamibacterales bacterium]|nr:NAD-dependent epimerase/dehydratase family protein [Vicinamibacterales bacterium]